MDKLRIACSRFALAIALPLLLVPAAWAAGDSMTLEDAARNLDPSIESVWRCGDWRHGDDRGAFRLISGWLYGHSELYVQWVADPVWYPEKGQKQRALPRVMATAVFPELDGYEAATDLEHVRCVRTRAGWAVTADADNANDDGPTEKYRLRVQLFDEPGKFRVVTQHK